MKQQLFDVGDVLKLKPKKDIIEIRNYYLKHDGIVNADANDTFFNEVDHFINTLFTVIAVEKHSSNSLSYYQLRLKDDKSSDFSEDWIMFEEYFVLANNREINDNIVPMFGTMTYEVNTNAN